MKPADDDPPLTPGRFGHEPRWGRHENAGDSESALTKVARVFAIIRDLIFIALVVLVLLLGGSVLDRLSDPDTVAPGVGDVGPTPVCASPSADQWGTFCPETPGG